MKDIYYGYVYETYRKRIQTAEAQLTDGLEKAVIQGKVLRVEVEKNPFRICVYDAENTQIHADIVDLATWRTAITVAFTQVRLQKMIVFMDLVRKAECLTKLRNL